MSRHLYSNLFKIIGNFTLFCIFAPSLTCLSLSLIIDKKFHVPYFIFTCSCVILWTIWLIAINILNKNAKNKIVFQRDAIQYAGKIIYKNELRIKYFKFYISIIEPSLVIPKLHLNANHLSVTCYLSKKDIKKLENLGYKIDKI